MVRTGLFLLFLMIFALPLQSLTDSKQQPNCDKAFATNFIAFWNKNKHRLVDANIDDFLNDYRTLTEDIMLRLAMFDNAGCSSETQKRIQALYENSSKLQKSYEQLLILDTKFDNAMGAEKMDIYEQTRKERNTNRKLHKIFLRNSSDIYDYVSAQIN